MDAQRLTPPDRALAVLAHRQHGVVSRPQLLAAGLTADVIRRGVTRRRLIRIHRGVYAVGHARLRREGWWMAAVLSAGPGAVLSHRDAAALWDLRRAGATRIDVSTMRTLRGPEKVALHRVRRLPADEVTTRDGIPVTTVARTLLDLGDVVPERMVVRALEEADRRDLFDLRALHAVIAANPGRRGIKPLRAALAEQIGATLTRSDLEERMLALIDRLGLPTPLVNARVHDYEVDFLWRAERLVVEDDSHRFHRTRSEFERDRAKDLDLRAAGYAVLRFSDRQIARADPRIAAALLTHLGTNLRAVG